MYEWDFSWVMTYKFQLLKSFLVTLLLNFTILGIGSIGGLVIALLSFRKNYLCIGFVQLYVMIFRALPVLVMLVWVFFCVPVLFGGIRISAFVTAVIVLSLNLSAFVAEIIRAGMSAVPKIHIESALAVGFSKRQTVRFITLPIAFRIILPPLVGQYINSIKLSVLASVIAVPELLNRTSDIISQTYRPLEFYTVLAIFFLIILVPGTLWAKHLEKKAKLIH
ncbi:MAG: amino acid ABC transporter permease [Candidatus Brocadiaceae bacterium]|nr:amino acid ABC transporter permease [Candidatus Brocadiaceae bacterium]